MKNFVPILSIIWLICGCTPEFNISSQIARTAAECPPNTTVFLSRQADASFYQKFDYHIRNIEADANTIKFQTVNYDFVFCRANSKWTVQLGTIKSELLPPKDYAETAKEVVNPVYKNIEYQRKTYQYRVLIEPKFVLDKDNLLSRPSVAPEKDKIVFELIEPESKQPQRQTLYTLQDVQNKYSSTGVQLGFPRITASLIHGNHLWWSIAFEQGEGNTGIATIVGYDPQADKFTVIQPQQLKWQQITDLAITGDESNPTFWMGTNISSEGNAYIPASGLVAYHPNSQILNSGLSIAYTVHNSPIVGAIPDKLRLEEDTLWVGTGNGVCQVKWQVADRPESWSCWRFAAMAKIPADSVPLYSGLTEKTPAMTLPPDRDGKSVEVLWWSPLDFQSRKGRYELRNTKGFRVKLNEGTKRLDRQFLQPGKPPVYWSGFNWHWDSFSNTPLQKTRFVRGFDEVASNNFGGGSQGIGSDPGEALRQTNWKAMRGDLELLKISPKSTSLKYYSGWVDEKLIQPYLTVVPQEGPATPKPNPLAAIATQLQP
jgi:hypothetical protein